MFIARLLSLQVALRVQGLETIQNTHVCTASASIPVREMVARLAVFREDRLDTHDASDIKSGKLTLRLAADHARDCVLLFVQPIPLRVLLLFLRILTVAVARTLPHRTIKWHTERVNTESLDETERSFLRWRKRKKNGKKERKRERERERKRSTRRDTGISISRNHCASL